jgi:dihydroorotase
MSVSSQPSRVKIVGGTLLLPDGQLQAGPLLIAEGHISAVGAAAEGAGDATVINAEGCIVSPGLVDLWCNLREPGDGQKGNITSETRAAAHGGFTTVCASPETSPVNDSGAVTHLIRDVSGSRSPIRVLPIGATTKGLEGELLSDMAGLVRAGCVALANGRGGFRDARVLHRAMAYARTFGITLMLHPENQALAADGYAHDGRITTRLGLLGIPEVAETTAVMEMLLLAEETGVRLHLAQISCGRSVQMIAEARRRGVNVTADVAMHQLLLTEEALSGFDSRFHVRPPLRSEADRQGLLEGVRTGVIGAIVSAHQPHDTAAKQAPLAATEPGLSSVESVLSMGLMLVERQELSLSVLLQRLTAGPAAVLGRKAALEAGAIADICVFAPQERWLADSASLVSAGHHVPVVNHALHGVVRLTMVGGRTAWPSGYP